MNDPTPSGFMQHDDDYEAGVPNIKKRVPERVGKPRAAREDDIRADLDRIIEDILARDGRNLREMRYRGKGHKR